MPEIRLISYRTEKWQREILCPVDGRTGRKADLENLDPSGHPGCCGRELHMETVSGTDEAEGIPVEAEPEVPILKTTGDGAVYSSAFLGKRIWGGRNPGEDPASQDPAGVWNNTDADSEEELLPDVTLLDTDVVFVVTVVIS